MNSVDHEITAAPGRQVEGSLLDFVALAKPRILMMVLITTSGSFWLAAGGRDFERLLYTLVGFGLVVSGANALNMYIERDTDRLMTRTQGRPLPAGRLQPRMAMVFGLVMIGLGFPIVIALVNLVSALVIFVSLGLYVLVYTPLKRHSSFALLVGSIPGAAPPLVGWTAATGTLEIPGDLPGLILFAVLFLWQVPHFLAISLFRKDEYARAGLQLLPLEIDDESAKHQAIFYLLALVPVSLLLVTVGAAGMIYLAAALLGGLVFLGVGLLGLRKNAGEAWARQLFIVSLLYLTGIFGALVLDQIVGSRLAQLG
ncbi:MAG: heme o synthase [Chrysiogenetes bacterium]|nr:heme o synthase [Chrysiogenetes bacterium]